MKEIFKEIYEDKEFMEIVGPIIAIPTVQEMKKYRQHYDTSCFDHCLEASYICYKYCKKHKLDYVSMARAAMVHDLFLYDWRKRQPDRKGLHAFTHPRTAYENACKIMDLNKKEKDIILKHMWPLTLKLPRYRESFLLTIVDKRCALIESYRDKKERRKKKKKEKNQI